MTSVRAMWIRMSTHLVLVALAVAFFTLGTFTAIKASEPVDAGYRDFSYGTPNGVCSSNPTAEKPESKLWWADGYWWGSLCDDSSKSYFIYRLDLDTQDWEKTGAMLDTRSTSRGDVLWDGTKLYLASHLVQEGGLFSPDDDRDWGRIYRYSYDPATDTYTADRLSNERPDKDFEYVNKAKSETLTLAKDSTGQLWVTYTMSNTVWVNRTLCGASCTDRSQDGTWGQPFAIPDTNATNLDPDDVSSIISFRHSGTNYIGVMWSNQTTDAFYFAVHPDNAADETGWTVVAAYEGEGVAEDHMDLKALQSDPAGNVFAVVKTNLNTPIIALLVCKSGSNCTSQNNWQVHTVYQKSGDLQPTRPILQIDDDNDKAYVFATGSETGGTIYYKSSPIDTLDFGDPTDPGQPFIKSAADPGINNPTSTKQNVNSQTGLVVLASDSSTKYYLHNYLCLDPSGTNCPGGTEPTPPPAPEEELELFMPVIVKR